MKLQIDTENKTIKIEEPVKLGDFLKILNNLFPENSWEDYTLETHTKIEWEPYPYIPYDPPEQPNPYPWYPIITYSDSTADTDSKITVWNVDINSSFFKH